MAIHFFNSLSKRKEPFVPINPRHVTMYVCGPTVYDRAHIGNARAMVVFDTVFRFLSHIYPKVTYVRNITDVDDKIMDAARANHESIANLTTRTTAMFHEDMAALHLLPPTEEPRATDHIKQMIVMIERLILQQHAYANEGHVLFDVTHFPAYGKLSRRELDDMIEGARIEVAPYKKNPHDFILWKPSSPDEPGWDSPWGRGRPGWHIECSAMSTHYLGANFDIHGGGADLQFPHHENEIAQSCAAHPGSHYAQTWIHNGFLTVKGEKMSKSLGNFITVHDLIEQGISGEVIRLVLLSTHYSKPLDWQGKAVDDAKKALDSFYLALHHAGPYEVSLSENGVPPQIDTEVFESLSDDLNTPKAVASLHLLAKQVNKEKDPLKRANAAGMLVRSGQILGLLYAQPDVWLGKSTGDDEAKEIEQQIAARALAKEEKNWAEADRIRNTLLARNIILEDNASGKTEWRKF